MILKHLGTGLLALALVFIIWNLFVSVNITDWSRSDAVLQLVVNLARIGIIAIIGIGFILASKSSLKP